MAVGTPPVGERGEQVRGTGQHDDAVDVGHLDVPDPLERRRPARASGSSVSMTPGGRDAVEAQQPHRVDPVLAAPPHPGPLDGGDRVDERAVEVEQHPRERRVERARRRARRTTGGG